MNLMEKKLTLMSFKENVESYIKLTSAKNVKTTIKNVRKLADSELAKTNQSRSKTENKETKGISEKTFFIKELKIVDLKITARISSIKKIF